MNQTAPSGSPLLFQHKLPPNNLQTLNPLLQPPTSVSHLPSPLIQPSIPSAFQPPLSSAFTPLNPSNTQQSTSLIQPKLTIGNQQPPIPPLAQPVQFPFPKPPTTQGLETTHILPPLTQDNSIVHHPPLPPPLLTTNKDSNPTIHPPPPLPPSQMSACK